MNENEERVYEAMYDYNFVASTEAVETYAIRLYDEFEKIIPITDEIDPFMMVKVFNTLGEVLADFDRNMQELKSLQNALNIIEADKEELEHLIGKEKMNNTKNREKIIQLQYEIDLLKNDSRVKVWERDIEAIEREKNGIQDLLVQERSKLTKVNEENKKKDLKIQNLEHLYAELMLEYKSLTEVTKILEEDLRSFSNTRGEKYNIDKSQGNKEEVFLPVKRKQRYNNPKCMKQWPCLPQTTPVKTNNGYEPLNNTSSELQDSHVYNKNSDCQINKRSVGKPNSSKGLTQKLNSRTKGRLLFVADSHAKRMWNILDKEVGDQLQVQIVTYPGARFNYVAANLENMTQNFTKKDHAVFLAGSNDCSEGSNIISNLSLEKIEKTAARTNVHVISIPFRYDKPEKNFSIHRTNSKLRKGLSKLNIDNFIDISSLHPRQFTKQGFHLNIKGKNMLSKVIKDHVKGRSKEEVSNSKPLRISKRPQEVWVKDNKYEKCDEPILSVPLTPKQTPTRSTTSSPTTNNLERNGEITRRVLSVAANSIQVDIVVHNPGSTSSPLITPLTLKSPELSFKGFSTPVLEKNTLKKLEEKISLETNNYVSNTNNSGNYFNNTNRQTNDKYFLRQRMPKSLKL